MRCSIFTCAHKLAGSELSLARGTKNSLCFFLFLYVFLNIFSVIVLYVCLFVLFYGPRCLKLKLMMMTMMMKTRTEKKPIDLRRRRG